MTDSGNASWISQLPKEEKILIKHNNDNRQWRVEAPLPDDFGFSVGSQFSAPFDSGGQNENIKKLMAYTGVNNKVGLTSKKFYEGPEATEISLDLNFESFYSASNEVIQPIVYLMIMSVGHMDDLSSTEGFVKRQIEKVNRIGESAMDFVGDDEEVENKQDIAKMIKFLRAPNTVDIHFGKTFVIKRAYISSVTPSFSNVLDNYGYPIKATCSLSIELEAPMTKVRIAESFGMAVDMGEE